VREADLQFVECPALESDSWRHGDGRGGEWNHVHTFMRVREVATGDERSQIERIEHEVGGADPHLNGVCRLADDGQAGWTRRSICMTARRSSG